LPTLARLVEGGVSGRLDCGAQAGVTLWASVASGVAPTRHGIVGTEETRPDGGGVQPVGFRSWRAAPLWSTLHMQSIPTIVVGWPGTACATDWTGVVVDERYAHADAAPDLDWPLAPRCIHPASLRDTLADLRVHPADLAADALRAAPAPVLAHAASLHAAATALIESEAWACLAVHYGPLLSAGGVGAAMLFDAMLARLLALAGKDTDILIVGSGGSGGGGGGGGMLVAAGPGFAADVLVHGARPVDVAATVLARFGLRQEDAAGRVVEGATHGALRVIQAPAMAAAATHGDRAQPDSARVLALAAHAMADGDFGAAAALLEPAWRHRPTDPEIAFSLGQCRFFLGDGAGTLALGKLLIDAWPQRPWGPMMVGAGLMLGGDTAGAQPYFDSAARLAGDDPLAALRLGAIALHLGQARKAEAYYAVALAHPPCAADARAGMGLARLAQGDADGGEAQLKAALGLRYHAPALHHQLGVVYASQGRWVLAAASLRTSLAQRPGVAEVVELLRRVDGEAPSTR
jgi:Flp pilus assembly protein TadD